MSWTFIVIEGYCLYDICKDKYMKIAPFDPNNYQKIKWKKIKNDLYKKDRRPKYCSEVPRYICLEKKCPFFGFSEANVNKEKKISKNKISLIINE